MRTTSDSRRIPALGTALSLLSLVAAPQVVDAQQAPWPTDGWSTATPESQGLDSGPLQAVDDRVRGGEFGHIDRLLVIKNGYLVVNHRYENDYREISRGLRTPLGCGLDACRSPDESHAFNYIHPDWHPYFQGRDIHSLQSVTKSVTSALIGIAVGRGEILGTDARLPSFFEEYDLSALGERFRRATLDDLLTMRSGIEWHEQDRPFDDTNTTILLERSDDWIQFTLDQPMDADPGRKWVYNSGGSHLMSGVIRDATGQFVDAYAEEHLFGPLGIDDYHWKKTPRGYPDTEGGLYLEAEQLAKVGYLYLRGGSWDGEQILPEGWAEASTLRRVERVNPAGWGYGYQWWRPDSRGLEIWAGLGFGGQNLVVIPELDLVAVINAWNLFGAPRSNIFQPFLDALIDSAANSGR